MVNLDDQSIYASIDKYGMRELIKGLPEQCRRAWRSGLKFSLPKSYADINKIVIIGMGGSAIGGDLLKASVGSTSGIIIYTHRDYDLPGFIDEKTLVVASSYSGNTEETISAFMQALEKPCKKLAITTGGKIIEIARQNDIPVFIIDQVSPPRAALGYSLLPMLAFMQNLRLISSKTREVESMISSLEKLEDQWCEKSPIAKNQAKKLSLNLYGKIAVIYGAGILTDVARRWKTQINENSKAWAFFETLPELNHNAVLGYNYPDDMYNRLFIIFLRCPSIQHRTLIRYGITAELLDRKNIAYQYIDSGGTNPIKHVMSLVLLGDWVSYYLSILYGIDPSPVPEIDLLKKRLAEMA